MFKVALVIELQRWGEVFKGHPISVLISVFNDILSKAPRMFRYSKYINSYIFSPILRSALFISYIIYRISRVGHSVTYWLTFQYAFVQL